MLICLFIQGPSGSPQEVLYEFFLSETNAKIFLLFIRGKVKNFQDRLNGIFYEIKPPFRPPPGL